uniref:Sulfatase N-terminal domain-containing protein n=2 Tax=Strongyloides stercoralis TaxID=6248 RepID=A0A0K0ERP2_STRER
MNLLGKLSNNNKSFYFIQKVKVIVSIIIVLIIIQYIFFLFFYNEKNYYFINIFDNIKIINETKKIILNNGNNVLQYNDDECTIKSYNPWSKNIFQWINIKKKLKRCNRIYKNNYYNLENGVLSLKKNISKNITCFYYCHYPFNDRKMKDGNIFEVKKPIILDCDIFTFYCKNNKNQKIFLDFIFHINRGVQYKNIPITFLNSQYKIKEETTKYDVHIYVIDSLSYYNALRSLQNTRQLLLNKLNGIEMKFLNINGENSRPNAYSFLLNKNSYNVTDAFGNKPQIINDFHPLNPCNHPLNISTYIVNYYKQMGYITLNAEDYHFFGMFNYFSCVGIDKNLYHHSFRPYQLLRSRYIKDNFYNNRKKEKCFINGLEILEFLEEFLKKNTSQPKFSLIWNSFLIHDNMNNLFDGDDKIYSFYLKNLEKFNNSFTILMGDHGYRLNNFQKSDIGFHEHKNPYFMITIPYNLRNNAKLINNLKINSEKHISFLDVYATLLDILTEGRNNNFINLKPYDLSNVVNDKIKGKSLIRPLPDKPRSCYEMYIPIQYCLCQLNFKYLPQSNKKEYDMLKEAFIYQLNKKIIIGNLTNICEKMFLDNNETFFVRKVTNKNGKALYQVEAVTLPGKAMYRAMFNEKIQLIGNDIIRLNQYKHQAEVCEKKSEYRKFCYCKKLLNN